MNHEHCIPIIWYHYQVWAITLATTYRYGEHDLKCANSSILDIHNYNNNNKRDAFFVKDINFNLKIIFIF